MTLSKRYNPAETEPRLQKSWQDHEVYFFSPHSNRLVFSIDTPPPTVSGYLHLGHVYSYTHTDLIARFRRMKGDNVFYPMGFDDNGLPTERLVEKRMGIRAIEIGRQAFIEKCLQVSEAEERDYQALWQRLGLSIDWRYSYRTIDANSRRISQWSFIDLYQKGRVYRTQAPTIWCPECHTAIAQADLDDIERTSTFFTIKFPLNEGYLLIATTRPELLPACVAVFIHPEDHRYKGLAGQFVTVPLFGQVVPILEDKAVDPQKGTGVVMCCTFGDTTDVQWWKTYHLPLLEAIGQDGRLTHIAGVYAGLALVEGRQQIVKSLDEQGQIVGKQPTSQSVRVHERCDTPVEYRMTHQWFIRILGSKDEFLAAGEKIHWSPESMQVRYRSWVENLAWDWCISRQRYFGVPFPLWYCRSCGEVMFADEEQLPIDPMDSQPTRPCSCGSVDFLPEKDILDTWATSSMTPQIVGRWHMSAMSAMATGIQGEEDHDDNRENELYRKVSPAEYGFSMRPQAHEIIRTWAFYTIVKSTYHFNALPWKSIAISGWGIAGEGMGKISKSRGGGPMAPLEMIQRYSADAVRYWAASTGPGKDAVISEEKIQMGAKLVTKLWNVARFSEPFLAVLGKEYYPVDPLPESAASLPICSPALKVLFSPADRWILSRTQRMIRRVTELLENYDYATAKSEIETFFWRDLADNYLEMCKQRLYAQSHVLQDGARFTLHQVLLVLIKLFAPFLPYVTEEIYQGLFAEKVCGGENGPRKMESVHTSSWPVPDTTLEDDTAESVGEYLVNIATAVRRYKSERSLPLAKELQRIQLILDDPHLTSHLREAIVDLKSITRALEIEIVTNFEPALVTLPANDKIRIAIDCQD